MRWPTVNASRHAKLSSLKAHPQKLPGKLPVPPSRRRVHSTSGVTEILSGPPSGRPRLSPSTAATITGGIHTAGSRLGCPLDVTRRPASSGAGAYKPSRTASDCLEASLLGYGQGSDRVMMLDVDIAQVSTTDGDLEHQRGLSPPSAARPRDVAGGQRDIQSAVHSPQVVKHFDLDQSGVQPDVHPHVTIQSLSSVNVGERLSWSAAHYGECGRQIMEKYRAYRRIRRRDITQRGTQLMLGPVRDHRNDSQLFRASDAS